MLAVFLGLVVLGVAFALGANWTVALSCGWGATALTVLVQVWRPIHGMSASETRARAQSEDFSRPASDIAVLAACSASLVAIAFLLARAGRHSGTDKALLVSLAIVVVALSWATVHTIYALKYGDLYYGLPEGGIDFNDRDQPDYRDFAYLAFTIGMTYQVSDTSLETRELRRVALRHALLSFLFGAVILAVAINTVASLLK